VRVVRFVPEKISIHPCRTGLKNSFDSHDHKKIPKRIAR